MAYVRKLEEKGAVVELTRKAERRTLPQNAYLHVLLGYFAGEYGVSLEEAKLDFFKRTCNRELFTAKSRNRRGRVVERVRSTRDLTTAELSLAIDRFRNWSAKEAGIYLPEAGEHGFLAYAQNEMRKNSAFL